MIKGDVQTPVEEIHRDSCGKAKTMRPRSEWFSREEAQREPTESEVYFRNGSPTISYVEVYKNSLKTKAEAPIF
jgi:hypothetical protein